MENVLKYYGLQTQVPKQFKVFFAREWAGLLNAMVHTEMETGELGVLGQPVSKSLNK